MEQVIQLVNSLVHRGYGAGPGLWRDRRRRAYAWHVEILEAIRDRRPAQARSRMIEHLQEVEEYILSEIIDQRSEEEPPHSTEGRMARQ
jgi:DNA-binding FadR family transcriptional regulator